jgi:hypothetical protein
MGEFADSTKDLANQAQSQAAAAYSALAGLFSSVDKGEDISKVSRSLTEVVDSLADDAKKAVKDIITIIQEVPREQVKNLSEWWKESRALVSASLDDPLAAATGVVQAVGETAKGVGQAVGDGAMKVAGAAWDTRKEIDQLTANLYASAQLTLGGRGQVKRLGDNREEQEITGMLSMSAKAGVDAGITAERSVEKTYKGTLRKTFDHDKLEKVQLINEYEIAGGGKGADEMKEILEDFGRKNDDLVNLIREMDNVKMTVKTKADLSGSGLRNYLELKERAIPRDTMQLISAAPHNAMLLLKAEASLLSGSNYDLSIVEVEYTQTEINTEAIGIRQNTATQATIRKFETA